MAHVCLSMCVSASLGCLQVRADVMPLTCFRCQERNLSQNLLFGNIHKSTYEADGYSLHKAGIFLVFILVRFF